MENLKKNNNYITFKNLVILLRPHQYIKNFFIFLPLFFGLKINNLGLLFNTFEAFIAFCLIASSVYIFNDYNDMENDRKHPEKKLRPLASGTVQKSYAIIIMIVLSISGLTVSYHLSMSVFHLIVLYIFINFAYTMLLKKIVIIDIITISSGFIIRLFIGSEISNVTLSTWIVVMTFLLSLFIALAKRRNDLMIYLDSGKKVRNVIKDYNLKYINWSMTAMSVVLILSYLMYTITGTSSDNLFLTVIWVIIGIIRYMWITFIDNNSGSPTKIFYNDKLILFIFLSWLISFATIIY